MLGEEGEEDRASKATLVATPAAPDGIHIQSDPDERTISRGNFKRKRSEGPIPAQHSSFDAQPIPVLVGGRHLQLKGSMVGLLRRNAENLLGQATALVCMANVKAKEDVVAEEKKTR
ncbi:hypothetical protein ACSQ67_008772 [Phaseolus vulgaris]